MTKGKSAGREPRGGRTSASPAIDFEQLDAVLMDLDGVITETATLHAEAWRTMFNEYLRERAARLGSAFKPFALPHDYRSYVDGRPRFEGVACFLQSRGIYLPPGDEGEPPDKETVCGLGNRKNRHFLDAIRQHGVEVYQSSIDFIRRIKSLGLQVGVVTSSRNCREVLESAGIAELFDTRVDGLVARDWMLEGKPAPDTYLEAAGRLGVTPERAAVIEDAASGVQAGKAGHFRLVIGVSRDGHPEFLRHSGADIVVSDLSEIGVAQPYDAADAPAPPALDRLAEIRARIRDRRVAVFLDYDGTLTPIVERPELAVISEDVRSALRTLAGCCPVFVISGRDRSDVQGLVGLEEVFYAGCHGFDIAGPEGTRIRHQEGAGYVPVLAEAADELARRLSSIEGVIVENKTYAVAVHFRLVAAEHVDRVARAVDDVASQHILLRKTGGKKIFELRPNMNWDKGSAVLWLLGALDLDGSDVVPFYLGDDVTDRDAFAALRGKGIAVLVSRHPEPTCADYRLSDTAEVCRFLAELVTMLEDRD